MMKSRMFQIASLSVHLQHEKVLSKLCTDYKGKQVPVILNCYFYCKICQFDTQLMITVVELF